DPLVHTSVGSLGELSVWRVLDANARSSRGFESAFTCMGPPPVATALEQHADDFPGPRLERLEDRIQSVDEPGHSTRTASATSRFASVDFASGRPSFCLGSSSPGPAETVTDTGASGETCASLRGTTVTFAWPCSPRFTLRGAWLVSIRYAFAASAWTSACAKEGNANARAIPTILTVRMPFRRQKRPFVATVLRVSRRFLAAPLQAGELLGAADDRKRQIPSGGVLESLEARAGVDVEDHGPRVGLDQVDGGDFQADDARRFDGDAIHRRGDAHRLELRPSGERVQQPPGSRAPFDP